jgi:hypothetical protein
MLGRSWLALKVGAVSTLMFAFVLFPLPARAETQVLDAVDSGRYTSAGAHSPTSTLYMSTVGGSRNFFVFDLVNLSSSRPITSATLEVFTGVVSAGTFGGISYTLFDVSTPVATLVAGGSGLTGIYVDLGSGTPFSDLVDIPPEDAATVKLIPLLQAGVAALESARGGLVAVGGDPTGLGGNFAFGSTDVTGVKLVVQFEPTPAPALPHWGLAVLALLLVRLALKPPGRHGIRAA